MTETDGRIAVAEQLFKAWSSGNADAPQAFLTEDCVLYDIIGGEHQGWESIRAFFAQGIVKWPDLVLLPEQYWTSDSGVALNWVMSATVPDDRLGPENRGRKWRSEGMSYLVFREERVCREVDYHDRGAVLESLRVS